MGLNTRSLIWLLAALMLLTGCSPPSDSPTRSGAGQGAAVQPEPPPAPPAPTGMTETEWHIEMDDTTSKVADLLDSFADVMALGAAGIFSLDQVADLSDTFATVVRTHRVFWENADPPPHLRATTDLVIQALDHHERSARSLIRCVEGDPGACEDALELQAEATRLINRATAALGAEVRRD